MPLLLVRIVLLSPTTTNTPVTTFHTAPFRFSVVPVSIEVNVVHDTPLSSEYSITPVAPTATIRAREEEYTTSRRLFAPELIFTQLIPFVLENFAPLSPTTIILSLL